MNIISHRGNLNGANPAIENNPKQIEKVLEEGFEVEIDVWYIDGSWYLGHDIPQYPIQLDFLFKKGLWCHVKNIEALSYISGYGINYFWHQEDEYTLTSKGVIWCYPGSKVPQNGVALLFEKDMTIPNCKAICVDDVYHYNKKITSNF